MLLEVSAASCLAPQIQRVWEREGERREREREREQVAVEPGEAAAKACPEGHWDGPVASNPGHSLRLCHPGSRGGGQWSRDFWNLEDGHSGRCVWSWESALP